MPKKKAVTEEQLETMEQAGPAEEEMPETAAPEGEVMPSEETEDFSDPAGEGTLEPEADVPEPDMEQAPDFWSDSLEVSSADAVMGTASGTVAPARS